MSTSAKLAECKKAHDALRKRLVSELKRKGYSYPESEDFCVSGVFVEDPDSAVLEELCEYAAIQGNTDYDGTWKGENLFSLLKEKVAKDASENRFSISLCFGGLPPVLAVLSFLSVYSEIQWLTVSFSRDKWESRGDYSSKNRVRIKFENGEFIVGNSSKAKAPRAKKTEGFRSDVMSPSRLERSREYSVEKINAEAYSVTSKDKKYKVTERDGYFWCECKDFLNEPKNCKHIIAVKRFMNDPIVCGKLDMTDSR